MYICTPEGSEPRPAVLVIQGMHGANSFELGVAERFAERGYVAAVPDLFHRGPNCFSPQELNTRRRSLKDPEKTSDVNLAVDYLQKQPYVLGDQKMGILGFCMGGRTAYLMAATSPVFGVAADFYGGSVPVAEGGPSPLELTANMHCPIIIFDGEEDHNPPPEVVRQTEAELKRHGKVHEVHIYPGIGHAFMSAEGPQRRQDVIDDAWSRCDKWFAKYLPVAELAAARG
jgi:carboxymethylenebutenolidase